MEVYAAPTANEGAIDDDRDHLDDIREVLERFEEFDSDGQLFGNDNYRKKRFDLCEDCVKRFMQDPLGRRTVQRFELSRP
jgi:hypothetical protein